MKIFRSWTEKFEKTKIKLSYKLSKTNWSHKDYDQLPDLTFTYSEVDKKLTGKEDEILKHIKTFWQIKTKGEINTFQERYERELYGCVFDAINDLNDKWQVLFEKEIKSKIKH